MIQCSPTSFLEVELMIVVGWFVSEDFNESKIPCMLQFFGTY